MLGPTHLAAGVCSPSVQRRARHGVGGACVCVPVYRHSLSVGVRAPM